MGESTVVVPEPGIRGTLKAVLDQAKAMTPAEFRQSLVVAGIIHSNGELTAPYATTPNGQPTVKAKRNSRPKKSV